MKEFLSIREIDYASRDVANDAEARSRFEKLEAGAVPTVAVGGRWVPGVDLAQVARLVGIDYMPQEPLPAAVLIERLRGALDAAMRLIGQFPAERLGDKLPNRDRTCIALGNHIVEIAAVYLSVAAGGDFDRVASAAIPAKERGRGALAARARRIDAELAETPVDSPARPVGSFFGETTLHAVLERSAWHAAQHARQLAMLLERLGIRPEGALTPGDLEGLPLPAEVWDA